MATDTKQFLRVISMWLAAGACSKPEPATRKTNQVGLECRVAYECQSSGCADQVCVVMPRQAKESCGMQASCAASLVCHRSAETSRKTHRDNDYEPSDTYGDQCQTPEAIAEIEAGRARAAERTLLKSMTLT